MIKTINKKMIYAGWCLALLLALVIYYYGIQRTYYPDAELLNGIMLLGMKFPSVTISFRMARLFQASLFGIVAILTYDVAIRDNEWNIKWEATPLFLLFMAGLPFRDVEYWADYDKGWEYYPVDRYMLPMLSVVLLMAILHRVNLQSKGRKVVVALVVVGLVGWSLAIQEYTIFLCIVATTGVCVASEYDNKNEKDGKIFVDILGILLLLSFIYKILGDYVEFKVNYPISFVAPENILTSFLKFVDAASYLFGFDFSQLGIFNMTVVVYGVRLLLAFFVIWCITDNVRKRSGVIPLMEKACSFGILFLFIFSCVVVFDGHIYSQNMVNGNRMQNVGNIVCILPLFVIVLCRNCNKLGEKFYMECLQERRTMFIVGVLLFLAIVRPVEWMSGMTVQDSQKEDYVSVLQELDSRGLENGVMIDANASVITAMSEGAHMIVPIECDWETGTSNSTISLPSSWQTATYDFVIYSGSQIGQRWKDYYGIPDATIYSSVNCEVMVYEDSISLGTMAVACQRYRAGDLQYSGEVYATDYFTRVCRGAMQFGPFISLESGKYLLQIEERRLSSEDFLITYDGGEKKIEYEIIEQAEDRLVVSFELQQNVEDLEFVISNTSEQDVDIYSYYLLGQ